MSSFLKTLSFATAVQALALDSKSTPAKATGVVVPDATFHSPEITEAPNVRDLLKRDDGQTVLVAPDNTCGFFDGSIGAPYYCNAGYTCALVTTAGYGFVACCDSDQEDCGVRVGCMDYFDVYSSSYCDSGCLHDTLTAKCTYTDYPYCGTVTMLDGITDYYCNSVDLSSVEEVLTTYDGEDDGRSFTPVVVTLSTSDSTATTGTADDGNLGPAVTVTASSSSSTGPPGPTHPSTSKSSTPVGAIAGGAVGGVALLALIAAGIFFLVRHNKKNKNANGAPVAHDQPTMHQTQTPNSPPVSPPMSYAPPYANNAPPYGPQHAPQPGYPPQPGAGAAPSGYFGDQKPGGFVGVSPVTAAASSAPDRHDSTSPLSQFSSPHQHQRQGSNTGGYFPASPATTINSGGGGPWGAPGHDSMTALTGGIGHGIGPGQPTPPPPQSSVPPTVHEAGGNVVGERDLNADHRGQFHELQ
ncbi:hypothetical protein F5Y15DRAFT_423524 [Xylariaceae sp. FL0016]|nr:hypothetical protein F5Y15DRAFT_423524 [Xylariaceae sp. FL0016]